MREKRKKIPLYLGGAILIIVFFGFSARAFHDATISVMNAYEESLEQEKEKTYEKFYEASYEHAEEKYHVKNEATISVEQVTEKAELEVLQVSDTEYIMGEEKENWTSFTGTGVFTVNLKEAEYVIDQERHYVLVRIPAPELSNFSIDGYEIYQPQYNQKNVFEKFVSIFHNGTTSQGVELAREDIAEGQKKVEKKLCDSQLYDKTARSSAESMIRELVVNFNPDVENLSVEVEFVD